MDAGNDNLSPSLEDYLEAILSLVRTEGTATVTEIAQRLNVAKPSVVKALKRLRKRKLITQEPYGSVNLTAEGRDLAREVRLKHKTLVNFLVEFLGVDAATAEGEACALEHRLSARTTNNLLKFIDVNREGAVRLPGSSGSNGPLTAASDGSGTAKNRWDKRTALLSELAVGQRGLISAIRARGRLRRRLQDMGVVKGVVVEVINTAPLGDPVDVKVRGFDLALRKAEAALISVEIIK